MHWTRYLPPHLTADQVEQVIGVISDTHTPRRWPDVPSEVYDIFADVDLILHAGDVGGLWVLDKLSQIAPVIGVHGNDESPEAVRQLPYQQLLSVCGQRILLWHSHFPDREEEMAFRKQDDTWDRILNRHIERAKQAGCTIAIYGHTHVPMATTREDVLILNPGAIAAGTLWARQTQTVMLLFLGQDQTLGYSHVRLDQPGQVTSLGVDLNAPYSTGLYAYQASFIDPVPKMPHFTHYKDFRKLGIMYQAMIGPYVWGEKRAELYTPSRFAEDVEAYSELHPDDKKLILDALKPYR